VARRWTSCPQNELWAVNCDETDTALKLTVPALKVHFPGKYGDAGAEMQEEENATV